MFKLNLNIIRDYAEPLLQTNQNKRFESRDANPANPEPNCEPSQKLTKF